MRVEGIHHHLFCPLYFTSTEGATLSVGVLENTDNVLMQTLKYLESLELWNWEDRGKDIQTNGQETYISLEGKNSPAPIRKNISVSRGIYENIRGNDNSIKRKWQFYQCIKYILVLFLCIYMGVGIVNSDAKVEGLPGLMCVGMVPTSQTRKPFNPW